MVNPAQSMRPMLMKVDCAQEIYSKVLSNRLIFQGLSDTEEFAVSKALNALTCLTELGLLQKPAL